LTPPKPKSRTFVQSLNDAAEGFLHAMRHERNMRVHFMIGFVVLLCAIALGVTRLEWIILSSIISFVMVAEMMNTAIEKTVDLVHKDFDPLARRVKHIAAGMVLVAAVNAFIIGSFIFSRYWRNPFAAMTRMIRYSDWQITLAALLVGVGLVIGGKALFHKGTPFRGGPISGHSAAAFSLWTAILFLSDDIFVMSLGFFIACLVGQSRLRAKIHSFWEVVAGAGVGILVTALLFQIYSVRGFR
jgi:diacylglycerol kinase (ATP)